MSVKIVFELMDSLESLNPTVAFKIANQICHTGDARPIAEGHHIIEREPAAPYHYSKGRTYCFYPPFDNSDTVTIMAVNRDSASKFYEVLLGRTGVVVVGLSDCFEQVCDKLGLSPNDQLDAMYPQYADR